MENVIVFTHDHNCSPAVSKYLVLTLKTNLILSTIFSIFEDAPNTDVITIMAFVFIHVSYFCIGLTQFHAHLLYAMLCNITFLQTSGFNLYCEKKETLESCITVPCER